MEYRGYLISAVLMIVSQHVRAELDFLTELGIHAGGDDLITVTFTDGSTSKIKAGEVLAIDLGIAWDMGVIEGRVTGGWKYDSISAVDGDIELTRYTHQFLLLYKTGAWRLGGGYVYHFKIELDGGGVASIADSEFDDTFGWTAQVNYFFSESAYVGLTYTDVDYDRLATLGNTSKTFDASSVAFTIGGRW